CSSTRRSFRHLVEAKLAVPLEDPSEAREVVGEADDPFLADRARQDRLLRREGFEREQVERRYPREAEMVAVGHEVGREEERLARVADAHGLRAAGVALYPIEPDPGKDLDALVDELELARGLERRVVVGEIRAARALVGRVRIDPLEALEYVRRARECGDELLTVAIGVAAGVIEVEMGVHDERHFIRSHAAPRQLAQEPRRLVDTEDLLRAGGELRSRTGLDHDDVPRSVPDEQTVHVQRDAIAFVRRLLPIPQRLRNDAEHRATVEPEDAVAEDLDLETTDAHDRAVWRSGRTRVPRGRRRSGPRVLGGVGHPHPSGRR